MRTFHVVTNHFLTPARHEGGQASLPAQMQCGHLAAPSASQCPSLLGAGDLGQTPYVCKFQTKALSAWSAHLLCLYACMLECASLVLVCGSQCDSANPTPFSTPTFE